MIHVGWPQKMQRIEFFKTVSLGFRDITLWPPFLGLWQKPDSQYNFKGDKQRGNRKEKKGTNLLLLGGAAVRTVVPALCLCLLCSGWWSYACCCPTHHVLGSTHAVTLSPLQAPEPGSQGTW